MRPRRAALPLLAAATAAAAATPQPPAQPAGSAGGAPPKGPDAGAEPTAVSWMSLPNTRCQEGSGTASSASWRTLEGCKEMCAARSRSCAAITIDTAQNHSGELLCRPLRELGACLRSPGKNASADRRHGSLAAGWETHYILGRARLPKELLSESMEAGHSGSKLAHAAPLPGDAARRAARDVLSKRDGMLKMMQEKIDNLQSEREWLVAEAEMFKMERSRYMSKAFQLTDQVHAMRQAAGMRDAPKQGGGGGPDKPLGGLA
eukprot:TRINITY_DN55418_c0_g1_i1.p1 TRINITY_DN55418_c0_g1~~TRINITY_DN55418_c0_g1_i1.p1  ORF type:complete len:288 (+),score=82.58 TRINITY_DN55418_c0_g1_i1:80-865(+)